MSEISVKPTSSKRGLLWILGGCVFVVLLMWGCTAVLGSGSSSGPSETEIRNQCREWAEDQLQTPATARFSSETVTSAGTNTWTVSGSVDAENGFGANVRAGYACDIRLDGDTWRGSATIIE